MSLFASERRPDRRVYFGTLLLLWLSVFGMVGGALRPLAAAPGERCFAETARCIGGRFLAHWEANGGLARNGYPLTGERRELLEDGREYTVQYFERVRLEYHPENAAPNDVLLGQFGRRVLSAAYARIHDFREYERVTAPADRLPGAIYFSETGHNLGGRFLAYWQTNGGLAQLGYPLTEERFDTLEDGKLYRTQYFERGRLELHPENAAPFDVLLGQFGRQILAENALLDGSFGRLYQESPGVRERLGAPLGPAAEATGAAQPFERGLMLWRGDQRAIYALVGSPTSGTVLQEFVGRLHFADTWAEGQPAGGGAAPDAPGRYLPRRGFYKVWREHVAVRTALGYATTPDERGYTTRTQEFAGGLLIVGDTPQGRFIYAIFVQRTSNGGHPIITYQAAWTERPGPAR